MIFTPLIKNKIPLRYLHIMKNCGLKINRKFGTLANTSNDKFTNLSSVNSLNSNLDLEKSIAEKLPFVCTFSDFTLNEIKYLINTEKGKQILSLLKQPEYHSIYLNEHKLVTLDRNKDGCWYDFWDLILADSADNTFYNQLKIISKGLIRDNRQKTDFYSYIKSPFGNKYFKRDPFSSDFALDIYKYCNEIQNPNFLYYSIYRYFRNEVIFFSTILDDLLGLARKDLANHNLGNFILYREQALCYSTFLLENLQSELDDPDSKLAATFGWIKELAENLAKFADTLPRDPGEDSV